MSNEIIVGEYLYWPHQLVGQGSFAAVYRGQHRSSKEPVAVKKIKINEMENRMNKLWSEIKIMKQLSHSCILKLYQVHLDADSEVLYLFVEWCAGGDLSQIIKANRSGLSDFQTQQYFRQIRDALYYLYQHKIMHRDLKPQNILIDSKGRLKICDFGLSLLADQNSLITTMCGSPMYMAPEIICDQSYTIKSDLWSLGVILYEMTYGSHPYHEIKTYNQLLKEINKPIVYPTRRVVEGRCLTLMQGLLQYDPANRIDWQGFFDCMWLKIEIQPVNTLITNQLNTGEYQFDSNLFTMSTENLEISKEIFYSALRESISDLDEPLETGSTDHIRHSEAIICKGTAIKAEFDLYDYLDNEYKPQHVAHSMPNRIGSYGNSPKSFHSLGSQVYKCMSKSYRIIRNLQ